MLYMFSDSEREKIKKEEKMKEEKEAIDKLVSDLPTEEEDYLDLTLTEEAEFLQEYKSLLNSLKS